MDNRLLNILHLVEQRTIENKIEWDVASPDRIRTKVADNTIIIRERPVGRVIVAADGRMVTQKTYKMSIYSAKGDLLDGLEPNDENLNRRMEAIFDVAKKRSSKVDETLDSIVRALEQQ